jgi:hypothetical protein
MGTPRQKPVVWTPEAIRGLGMTTDLETAAAIVGIGRTLAYQLARDDEFPVRLIRIRRRVLVPTKALLDYLNEPPASRE